MTTLVAYVPVPHEGYRRLFEKYNGGQLILLGKGVISPDYPIHKHLGALPDKYVQKAIESWNIFRVVTIAEPFFLERFARDLCAPIAMPDEDISRDIAQRFFSGCEVIYESVFLRWDRTHTLAEKEVEAHRTTSLEEFDREMMGRAEQEARKSSDWWIQVGGVIVRDSAVLLVGYNRHVPSPHAPYIFGDPRSNFKRGVAIELSTAAHVEQTLVARAARHGIALEGTSLYVTTFPCPPCAKAIAEAGITKLFFRNGYAMLDGELVLREAGVEIIRVQ